MPALLRMACMCCVLLFAAKGEACTAFQLKSQDGTFVYGRSMEFGILLDSQLLIVPRQMAYKGTAPGGEGMHWETKYGYVGMNQSLAKDIVSDGMNEKGLVASILYLPGYAEYEAAESAKTNRTLGAWELATFLLGTCATVEEVKTILPTILVAQQPIPKMGDKTLPLHFYVSDPTGAVLVIEYVGGKRHIYDNPLGALTNSPPFPCQANNLTSYINLSPTNVTQLDLPNGTVKNLGQGSGLLGLPGDYTAPSRFVKATLFSQWAQSTKNASEAVNMAFHILNTFDIFAGIIRPAPSERENPLATNKAIGLDITDWVIVHDRTNLKTYFRTYESLAIEMVDLQKIDFTGQDFRVIPLTRNFGIQEVTAKSLPLTAR